MKRSGPGGEEEREREEKKRGEKNSHRRANDFLAGEWGGGGLRQEGKDRGDGGS